MGSNNLLVSPDRGWGSARSSFDDAPAKAPGEVLRRRRGPSVTELMARRIGELNADHGPDGAYRGNVLHPCRMAGALARWDPEGSVPTLRRQVSRARELITGFDALQDGFDAEYLGLCIAHHTNVRASHGDSAALSEYAAWLRAEDPEKLGSNYRWIFSPMWRFWNAPEMVELSRWAFPAGRGRSPYVPLIRGRDNLASDLLETPLVQVPAFRDRIIAELADQRVVGIFRIASNRSLFLEGDEGWQHALTVSEQDPLAPRRGTEGDIRYCDMLAHTVLWASTSPEDAPEFAAYWPLANRDRAIAALIEYLRRLPPP